MLRGVAVVLCVVSGVARAEQDEGRLVAVMDGPLMTEVYRVQASGIEKVTRGLRDPVDRRGDPQVASAHRARCDLHRAGPCDGLVAR